MDTEGHRAARRAAATIAIDVMVAATRQAANPLTRQAIRERAAATSDRRHAELVESARRRRATQATTEPSKTGPSILPPNGCAKVRESDAASAERPLPRVTPS